MQINAGQLERRAPGPYTQRMGQIAVTPTHVLEKNFRMYSLVRTARLRGLHMRFRLNAEAGEGTRAQRQLCAVLNMVFDPISNTSPTVALYFMQQAARAQHMRDVTTASGRNRRKIGTGLVSQDLIFLDMLGRYAKALGLDLTVQMGQTKPMHWKVSHPRQRRSAALKIENYYSSMREIARHGTRVGGDFLPKSVKFLAANVMPQVRLYADDLAKQTDGRGQQLLAESLDKLLGHTYHPKMLDLLHLGSLCHFSINFSAMPPSNSEDNAYRDQQNDGLAGILVGLGEITDCCRELNKRLQPHSRQAFLDWLAYFAEMLARFGGKRMKQMTGIYNSQVRSYLHHPLNLRFDVVVRTADAMGMSLRLSRRY